MSPAELDDFRRQLLRLRDELEATETASRAAAQIVELDQAGIGRVSRMDAMQAQQMALESERRRQLQLQRIESALRRIADGIYGRCSSCNEEIHPLRLQADPTFLRCVRCAKLHSAPP